jgi:hypothetical protein
LTLTGEISMRHIALGLVAALALHAAPSFAQLQVPAQASQQVRDPTMVVEDRGQKLEFFSTLRASPEVMSGGRVVVHRIKAARADAPFGPKALGVVYNHTIQVQGFLTGEVSFKPKESALPADIESAGYHGLKKIVEPNIYVVVARTPAELKAMFAALKARNDLEWVEIPVNYGISANSATAVLDAAKKVPTHMTQKEKTAGK